MMRRILAVMLVLAGVVCGRAATAPLYENKGTATTPQLDVISFVNYGTFNTTTSEPYETLNTLNYTNQPTGLMNGNVGFRFAYNTPTNQGFAANFVNKGTITTTDAGVNFNNTGFGFGGAALIDVTDSYFLVNATNVVNSGVINVAPTGRIEINGDKVSLARGGMRTGDVPGSTTTVVRGSTFGDFYTNPSGVTDLYSGVGTNNNFAGTGAFPIGRVSGATPTSGLHEVLVNTFTNRVSVGSGANKYRAWANTNSASPTNITVQVVYVATNSIDPNYNVAVKFGSSTDPTATSDAKMAMVEMTLWDIDVITGLPQTNYVYVLDSTAVITNLVFLTNNLNPLALRASTLEITRGTPTEWKASKDGNTAFTNSLLANANYALTAVTNVYAAQSVRIGNNTSATTTTSRFGGSSGTAQYANPTNQPGRIELKAKSLDLTLARIRSEGLLSFQADNLVGGAPLKIDAPTVQFNLGSAGGQLTVSNLIPAQIRRMDGALSVYSCLFTNQLPIVSKDPADPTLTVTNMADVKTHVLIVDPSFNTLRPVTINDFAMAGASVSVSDSLTIAGRLQVDAAAFTVTSGGMIDATASGSVDISNFPQLKNLTNSGVIRTANLMDLGSPDQPLDNLINNGTLTANAFEADAKSISIGGSITASRAPINLNATTISVVGGKLTTLGDLNLVAENITLRNSKISVGSYPNPPVSFIQGGIFFGSPKTLTDGGIDSSNVWSVLNGINLSGRPVSGDLLGTRVVSIAPRFTEAYHIWAGQDRGPVAGGFSGNAAVGNLVLNGDTNGVFVFTGAIPGSAIYVDYLELTNMATNVTSALRIDGDFKVYFGASSVPAESLDGLFDGKLRWVKSQVGYFSGVQVVTTNGTKVSTNLVNRSVLTSAVIDSDGDGIVNKLDPSPFDGVVFAEVSLVRSPSPAAIISWTSNARRTYSVEYSSEATSGEWSTLTTVTSPDAAGSVLQVKDRIADGSGQRFYRVRVSP